MKLLDVKPGTRVWVYVGKVSYNLQAVGGPHTIQIPAWVVRFVVPDGVVLGWKTGEICPPDVGWNLANADPTDPVVLDQYRMYGDHCLCESMHVIVSDMVNDTITALQEKRCKQCGIMNDLSAKKCYYCETISPTDY